MRLILTEYISSLKEDGELDKVIQDILRAYAFEIISKPERGRQFGVDIYAVGKDFEDGNKKKVFLITVKQGDLDRANWSSDQNSVSQSLDEIRTVFIRNNLAPQHKKLPIKIVVAFNGMIKQAVQQNWRGYAESHPEYEYTLWEIDFLVNHFQSQLLNEHGFTKDLRSLIRKTIIHLENPEYDLEDYVSVLGLLIRQVTLEKSKKRRLKTLKELHLVTAIILKYCEEAGNLKHAVKCAEKYVLSLWPALAKYEGDKDIIQAYISAYHLLMNAFVKYYHKIGYVAAIKDGFCRTAQDSLTYTYTVYEQLGIFSVAGLIVLQLHDVLRATSTNQASDLEEALKYKALEISNAVINTYNNNSILYTPRADDQHIEICLSFILLYKLGRVDEVKTLLLQFNKQIGEGLAFLNIFPVFSNDKRKIAELDIDYEQRQNYKYEGSNLLTVLIEWTAILRDERLYGLYKGLKEKLLPDLNLLLWFPEKDTENLLYSKYATSETGYALSHIELGSTMDDFRKALEEDYNNNCIEKEFGFIKQSIWSIGVIAMRHYRTYVFPYYWRQFL